MTSFEKELATLINKYSMENESDTPDFLLASYLRNCLVTFAEVIERRDRWYGASWPLTSTTYPKGQGVEPSAHTRKSEAHVVGEVIVGMSPIGSEHLCQGKCEYSPGLIKLDEIEIHSDDGVLLGVSDVKGNITDASGAKRGVTGKVDVDGNYVIDFSNYAGLTSLITYDYEYDLPPEDDNGK